MSNLELLTAGFSAIISESSLSFEDGQVNYDWSSSITEDFMQSGGNEMFLEPDELDPSYDFDFSEVRDDGEIYMRGGHQYHRPYGWNRIALKVRGKYDEGDEWLGPDGLRIEGAPNEWAVSYHGTKAEHVGNIVKEGYIPGPRAMFGSGVYSSPNPKIVEDLYAQEFHYRGRDYKIAFQNRVNPDRVKIIPASETGVEAEYWISQKGDIRPYGVIICKVR